jgi:NADH-quinone oxidoreductase B subunit
MAPSLLYGTCCCFIEFASGLRFYFDHYGLVPRRSSPRQADLNLIFTAGTVTMKMAPSLVRLYEQMPEPKYVIAMGACSITGGMFSTDSYSTVRGVDKWIPVDVYLPGCPPKPEAVIDALTKLRKKISREIVEDRTLSQKRNRYYQSQALCSAQYSYWNLRARIALSITVYFRHIFWNFFQIQKSSIFLQISELGRALLCRKRKSRAIFQTCIRNVKYLYKGGEIDWAKKGFISILQFGKSHIHFLRINRKIRWLKEVPYHELCTARIT